MRGFLTLITLIVAYLSTASAQPEVRDSLLKLLPTLKEDKAAVKVYLGLGAAVENSDIGAARKYYLKGLQLSRKIRDTSDEIRVLNAYSGIYLLNGQFDSCLAVLHQALPLARQFKDTILIGQCLVNMGQAYSDLSDFENGVKNFLEGLAIFERQGYKPTLAEVNNALLILYANQAMYEKAIPYGERSVKLSRELGNKSQLAQSLLNLSLCLAETNKLDSSLALLQESRQLGVELESDRILAYVVMNQANVALKKEDFAATKRYVLESLPLQRAIGAEENEAITLRALAVCYFMEKNYTKARENIDTALKMGKRLHLVKEQAAALQILSAIELATGNNLNGFRAIVRSDSITETLITSIVSERSANLEKKYETEKKETRIKELEAEKKVHELAIRQKNIQNYALIGSAVFLLVLTLLLYRNYRQKQKLQQQRITELEKEKRIAATEAVIKGEEQERTRLAQELHDGLGGMLSGIKHSFSTMQGNLIMTPENTQSFERSLDMLDSSIKEMRRVAHNMMPEALVKFGLDAATRDFCNDITKSGALRVSYVSMGLDNLNIEQTTAITIYRIVQELLNNTMKHAGAKTAIVQVMHTDGQIAVTVEDDGKGFDTGILKQVKGIGWGNIRSRVEFLNGNLSVQSEEGKGTSVHIELPA